MLSSKQLILFSFVALLSSVASCSYDDEWTTAQATTFDGKSAYSLRFPSYLKPDAERKLHKKAPIQYVNYYRNMYALAYDTLATNYRSIADTEITNLLALAQKPQLIDTVSLMIDGKPAFMGIYTGDVGRGDIVERIYYQLVFVQAPDRVYLIVQWTWDKYRDKYKEVMQEIAKSFKEG